MKQKLIALLAAHGVTLDANADEATTSAALDEALKKCNAEEKKEGDKTENPKNKEESEKAGTPSCLSADVASLREELLQMKKDKLIEQATRDGKVIPLSAESVKASPLSVIEDLVKAAKPGEVPTQKRGVDGKETTAEALSAESAEDKPVALSAEEKKMAETMGISEEVVRKFGKGDKTLK